jgi:hypothetical protein
MDIQDVQVVKYRDLIKVPTIIALLIKYHEAYYGLVRSLPGTLSVMRSGYFFIISGD